MTPRRKRGSRGMEQQLELRREIIFEENIKNFENSFNRKIRIWCLADEYEHVYLISLLQT